MATPSIALNPLATTVGQGLFADPNSYGAIQGQGEPDPSTRYRLRGGILLPSETLPMWGGCAVYATVPGGVGNPNGSLGPGIGRATALTGDKPYLGFSTTDQLYSSIVTPQSTVPLVPSSGAVNYYPSGSLARLCVACDPVLADLYGDPMNGQVSWDWINQMLVPYLGTLTISSGTYDSTTGIVTLTMSAAAGFSAGDAIVVSNLTGSGAYDSLDGAFTALSVAGTAVTYQAATGLGSAAITGGDLTLGSGSDVAIPVTVLRLFVGNAMTVDYSPSTGEATWNFSGNAALIQV